MDPNRPSRFNPYEDDPDRVDPEARTRRVERPATARQEAERDWREMVQPNWRESRRGRGHGGTGRQIPLPMSSSGFFMWVSRGGWKILAATAAGILILLLVILATGRPPQEAASNQPEQATQPQATSDMATAPIQVSGTDTPAGAQPTPTQPAPGQFFVVTGTGVEGLFLRDAPGGTILKTLPEGTRVEQIGPEQEAQGFVWKQIREPGGLEGWAATDYLQPAQ